MSRILASSVLVLAACGGSSSSSAGPGHAGIAAPVVACYAGTATALGNDAPTLLRRTADQAQGSIVEEVSLTGADGKTTEFHVLIIVAADGSFTMKEQSGSFTGAGRFVAGEAWHWTAWTSESTGTSAEAKFTATSSDETNAIGLRSKLSGNFSMSTKCLSTPGNEPLYSGVMMCNPAAARIFRWISTNAGGLLSYALGE